MHPSPLIGAVGVLEDVEKCVGMGFRNVGDTVVLLGQCLDEIGGSEYLATIHNLEAGLPPRLDLPTELNVQKVTLEAIREGVVKSAHDCSDGGLAIALAECCITGEIGAALELPASVEATSSTRIDSVLFGESQSRIVVSVLPENLPRLQQLAQAVNVPLSVLGTVGGDNLVLNDNRTGAVSSLFDVEVRVLDVAWRGAIRRLMQ